jgi:thymidylate kinase
MLIATEGLDGAGKSTARDELIEHFSDEDVVTTTEPYDDEWLGLQVRDAISDDSTHPLSVFLVFMADHVYHYDNVVKPALEKGNIVISDRYIDSRYAYQGYAIDEFISGNTLNYIRKLQESEWAVKDNDRVDSLIETAQEDMPEDVYQDTPQIGRYFYGLSQNIEYLPPMKSSESKMTDPQIDFYGLELEGSDTTWTKLPDKTILINVSVETSLERQGEDKEVFEYEDFLIRVRENYLSLAESDPDRFIVVDGEQSKENVIEDVISHISSLDG